MLERVVGVLGADLDVNWVMVMEGGVIGLVEVDEAVWGEGVVESGLGVGLVGWCVLWVDDVLEDRKGVAVMVSGEEVEAEE